MSNPIFFFLRQNMNFFPKYWKYQGWKKEKKYICISMLNQALLDAKTIHSRAILCCSVQQIAWPAC